MAAIFLKLIEQLNSSVFVLIAILVFVAIVLYKAGKWSEIFKSHEKKIIKMENLAVEVISIGIKVDLIYEHTLGPKRTVKTLSPINLTNVGQEIIEKIKANDILERCISKLEKEVEKEKPNSAYDIQMVSMKISKGKMLSFLFEAELATIKQEAFERGLLIEDIMSVFGVLLRNHILNKNGISISEVDKNARLSGQ